MPTASNNSNTRLRARSPRRPLWRARLSPFCSPTVSTGLSEVMGSWKIIAMRSPRTSRIAMIFQEPMTSLNPVLTVGGQIGESLARHKGLRGDRARKRVLELLDAVGIPDSKRRYGEYPHQLSGGKKQRVMIAIALAGEPE